MRLLACTQCRRQYNAAGLAPGEDVACRCGAQLCVADARERTVEAQVCSNCGAPAQDSGEHCSHCKARFVPRATLVCPECATRLPDDSRHCKACGVELCPQELHPLPRDVACPRCAGELQLRLFEEADLTECKGCGGIWLEPERFEDLCRKATDRPRFRFTPSTAEVAERPAHLRAYVDCPRCARGMLRRQFRHEERASGVVLDLCRDHGVWLDHLELEHVLAFLRDRESGLRRDPPPAPARVGPRPATRVRFQGGSLELLVRGLIDAIRSLA